MKKLIYLFAVTLLLSLWSCSEDDNKVDDPNDPGNHPDNVELELSTRDLVFEAQGGDLTFDITCNTAWTITNESDWCTLDKTSGNGNATVKVTTGVYEENEDRNTVLTVKAGDVPQTLTVTQKHEDALILSKDKFDVSQKGENITIEARSNIECSLTIPSRFQDWISEAPKGKGMEDITFNLTIAENEEFESREGFVIISGNELKDTVHIFQVANERTLILTQDTYNVPAAGKILEIELKTNVSYSMEIPDSVYNWVRRSYAKALREDKVLLEILENKTYDNRQAVVIFKDNNSDLTDTLHIFQSQIDALILGEKSFTVAGKGEDISVNVKSNVDYEISHPSWISQQPGSKALTEETLTFRIEENTGTEPRTGEIVLKDKNSALADTIHITQGTKDTYAGDVVLTTIEEVKAFAETGCKKIDGSLIVEGRELTTLSQLNNQLEEIRDSLIINCDGIINLDGLYGLKKVGENINIKDMSSNTPSLEGLNNLASIGGNLEIYVSLTSLKGLNSLQSIGGNLRGYFTSFEGIESLTNIKGDFEIHGGSSLASFKGFNSLQNIGGNLKLITGSGSLGSLVSFEGLENLRGISGNFEISATGRNYYDDGSLKSLTSFKGLENLASIGGNFEINANDHGLESLASFEGLNGLTDIGGSFKISISGYSLISLASFEGLENLASIGKNFKITTTSDVSIPLASFEGFESLSTIGENFELDCSKPVFDSFEGLENLTSISGDFICNQPARVESYLTKLAIVGGDMDIQVANYVYSSKDALDACFNNLKSVGGLLSIKGCYYSGGLHSDSYGTLDFPMLQEIGGECTISGFDIFDFSNVESIAGPLTILSVNSINNLSKLKSVEDITIRSVNSIGNLDNLKSVGDITIEYCENLYDFCNWIPVLVDYNGAFTVSNCGYNPTKYQILNGECSQTPEN